MTCDPTYTRYSFGHAFLALVSDCIDRYQASVAILLGAVSSVGERISRLPIRLSFGGLTYARRLADVDRKLRLLPKQMVSDLDAYDCFIEFYTYFPMSTFRVDA